MVKTGRFATIGPKSKGDRFIGL